MPIVPQISNPISNKSYSPNTLIGKQASDGGEQFDIIKLIRSPESDSVGDQDGGKQGTFFEQKDFLPMSVKLTKDPTMAVESLKQILNNDLLAVAKSNGYTELYGELDNLMKSIFLKPDDIVSEIMSQEKSTTLFGDDKFYDILRQLAGSNKGNSEDLKSAIGNMLKAVNFARNQQEILSALSSNMKFLSHYFSPNKALSTNLANLAEQWASPEAPANFEQIKNETLVLMQNVSDSLLNNDRVQMLIPLIVHNLSRYNTNKAVLNEYFSQLLTQVSGFRTREELTDAFERLARKILGGEGMKEAEEAYRTLKETGLPPAPRESAPYVKTPPGVVARYIADNLSEEEYINSLKLDAEAFDAPARSYLLGKENGLETIRNMLGALLTNPELKLALSAEMSGINDIGKLVDYLNDILRNMPDIPERQAVYERLSEIINGMVEKNELPLSREEHYRQEEAAPKSGESTLKNLISFVEKNIDHAAIKTLNNYNASNLLQSLINAPGVFTPLAHYILPLDADGLKSFGELWVDSDEGNAAAKAAGGKAKYHLFLTFEVEATGRFEVDLFADGSDVNLSFFYPESFSEKADPLLKKVGRIITQSGYNAKEVRTGTLKKPRDLTQVFPDILERRTGFNVKA